MLTGFSLPLLLLFVLVAGAGTLVYMRSSPETGRQHLFLLLTWIVAVLLVAIFVVTVLAPFAPYGFAQFLAPIIAGATALIILRRGAFRRLHGSQKSLALLALLISLIALAAIILHGVVTADPLRGELLVALLMTVTLSLLLAAAWRAGRRLPLALGFFALISLSLFNVLDGPARTVLNESSTVPRAGPGLILYIALPGLIVATIAVLLATGLDLLPAATGPDRPSPRVRAVHLALALLLLTAYVYTFAWAWLWDSTNDGLRGLAMLTVSGATAVAAALMLALSTTGWRRWSGLLYPLFLVGLMSTTVNNVWPAGTQSVEDMTETRAARIARAIEAHEAANGRYPDQLAQLVPGQLWQIPPPMIIPGESWCYEGSADHYRLGAVYREHWSAPSISVRVYASAGKPPRANWICDERLAQLRPRYDMAFAAQPTRQPLPASAAAAQGAVVQPLVSAPSLAVGTWSPGGAYLVYGETTTSGGETLLELFFLEAETGQTCRAAEAQWTADERSDGLGFHHAWLPDGRLLYVSEAGHVVAMSPCGDDVEEFTDRFPPTFNSVPGFDAQSGRALLTDGNAYWLLDGATLEAQHVPGVLRKVPQFSREWPAWSPGGEHLALALLDEANSEDAIILILDTATGEITRRLSLPGVANPDLPRVAWLTPDTILVSGQNLLQVLDVASDPPQTTELLSDVFLLDLSYPTDFSSSDWVTAQGADGYYFAVRANHPRNQALYVYDSQTEQVTVFEHDAHSLLFTPGGDGLHLPKWEDEPSYRDEYQIAWLDRPGESRRLTIDEHTPREHPQIIPQFTSDFSRMAVSSSQGVSLISIPGGDTIAFWELAGGGGWGGVSRVLPAPNGEALVVMAPGDGLYHIPLPPN